MLRTALFLVFAGLLCIGTASGQTALQLVRELEAVRKSNIGKITSWRGDVRTEWSDLVGEEEISVSKEIEFCFDAVSGHCLTSVRTPGFASEQGSPSRPSVMFRDDKYYLLDRFLRTAAAEVEYRPVQIFGDNRTFSESHLLFFPFQNMEYDAENKEFMSMLIQLVENDVHKEKFAIAKEGSVLTLTTPEDKWVYDLDKGGFLVRFETQSAVDPKLIDVWTASHVEIGGVWLPESDRWETHEKSKIHIVEQWWSNQEINFPTADEFTIVKLGGYRGQRVFDHIFGTQSTLSGSEYPPPPENLWNGQVNAVAIQVRNRSPWLIWVNIGVVIIVAGWFMFQKMSGHRPTIESKQE